MEAASGMGMSWNRMILCFRREENWKGVPLALPPPPHWLAQRPKYSDSAARTHGHDVA